MSCRQWSNHTGVNAPGQCSFQLIPETANPTKSCSICLTPEEAQRIATLRGFNADNGQLLWEKINFYGIGKSPSGAIFGYSWRNVTLGKEYEYIQEYYIPVLSYAANFTNATRFQNKTISAGNRSGQTWVGDCVKVDVTGAETIVMTNAIRRFIDTQTAAFYGVGGTGRFQSLAGGSFSQQAYNCSDDNLYIGYRINEGSNQFLIEMTDMDKRVTKHTLRIHPGLVFALTNDTPKWVVKCGTTVARFGLYATAADVETALATLEGVVSINANGGPLCQSQMDIDIEFDTVNRQFSHLCIEWASTDLPSISTVGTGRPVWSLETHEYFAPLLLRTLRMDFGMPSFVPGVTGIIASGNWGPLHQPAPFGSPKQAVSLLRWTENSSSSSVPNWRTINQKIWEVVPFDGMIQSQEWLQTGSQGSMAWGVSAIANGKVAITSAARRHPVLSGGVPFNTHLILDAASGTSSGYGYSGFLNGTRIVFGDGDNQYRTGGRHGFTPSGQAALYSEPLYVESYGTAVNLEDLRETDCWSANGAYAVGTKQIADLYGWTSEDIARNRPAEQQFVSSPAGDQYGYSYTAPWLTGTSGSLPSQTEYPWGRFRRDYFQPMSSFTRFTAGTEWQLLHGSYVGGIFYPHKQTSWFPLYVSLATVKDELNAWYGSIAGGETPIVQVNPFGDSPDSESASPPLPTWQRINEMRIYRDAGTPNAFAPLAPRFVTNMALKLRNRRNIQTHPLVGQNPATGEIVWQRDVGMHPTIANQPATGGIVAFANNTIVVRTECKAGVDTPIFPRGT